MQCLEEDIDINIIGTAPEDTNIQSEVIGTHRLIFLAYPNHRLCQLDRELTPKELIKHQLIAREVGSDTRLAIAAYFGALLRQTTRPPIVLDTNESIKQSILAGMGISLLSDATCELELKHGLLKRPCRSKALRSIVSGTLFDWPTLNAIQLSKDF